MTHLTEREYCAEILAKIKQDAAQHKEGIEHLRRHAELERRHLALICQAAAMYATSQAIAGVADHLRSQPVKPQQASSQPQSLYTRIRPWILPTLCQWLAWFCIINAILAST